MEDLLNWLENARVISDSVKEKITNAESPPNKLLDQLRNGLILVQLAQSLDKNLLQDSINVRPTTEILKEQNFKRFLNACKAQKISIPKPLKSFQGMVLQNLDDILEILFKVSKEIGRIHPKIKPLESIPKIDHALTMRLSLSDDIYESPYKMTRTSDIGAFYEDVGKLTKKDASKTGVENAFDELIAVESRYLTRIEVLAKLSKKITNLEVQGWFFDVTHWSSLLHKFHLCLKEQLDEVTINDFCLLFVKFKPGFTYYCPLIDSCEKIKHKLKTMSDLSSSEFRKAFEDAQKSLKNTEISHHKIMSPDELLNVPFTHIMRYLLMLRKFRDEAKKQKFFLNGLAEAIDTMKDVNNFIEIFKHDTDNMEATRLAVKTIHFPQGKGSKKSGKSVDFHRDFGRLMLDGKMKIAQNPNGKQPKTKYVMGFEFVIFILKISSAVSLRDTELSHEKSIYTKEIQSIQDDEKSLIQVFMQQDSFSIVETNPSKRLSIKSLLEKLCPKVSKVHQCGGNELTQVPPQYVLGKDPDRTNFTSWLAFCQSPDCKRLLPGRITIGVKCCNCKQLYHEHCFYEGFYKSPNPADETDDESKLAHRNPLLGMGHVAIGDRSLKNILTSNSQYPSGTYLIYCNEEKQNFVVAVKIKTEKKGLRIHKYIVVCEGNDRFQLEGANNRLSPFSSFTDLLNFYSKRMKLKDNLLELMDNERQRKEGQDEAFIDVFSDDSEAGEPNLPSNRSEVQFNRNISGRVAQCGTRAPSESELELESDATSDATSNATSDATSDCTSDSRSEFESASDSDASEANDWEGYNLNELIQKGVDDAYAKSTILKQRPGVFMLTYNEKTKYINIYVARKGRKITKITLMKTSTGFQTLHETGIHYATFSDLMFQIQTKTKVPLKPLLLAETTNEPRLETNASESHQAFNNPCPSALSSSSKRSLQSILERTLVMEPRDKPMGATSKELSNRHSLVPGASRYSQIRSEEQASNGSRNSTIEDPTQLPFYVGQIDKVKATKLLSNRENGTFLLRKNVQSQYRISLKQIGMTKHLIVMRENGLYWSGSQSDESISGLIDQYRSPGKRYHLHFEYKR